MFTVALYDETFTRPVKHTLSLDVAYYEASAVWGFTRADANATGPQAAVRDTLGWLRYYAVISNPAGVPVWAGVITRVSVNLGGVSVGANLDDMANRIAIAYTYDNLDGDTTRGTTEWGEDTASIARYGRKETRQSLPDADPDQANKKRDTALAALSQPAASVEPGQGSVGASLELTGIGLLTDWQYYSYDLGQLENDIGADIEHMIGYSLTSVDLGFRWDYIHDVWGRMAVLQPDNQISVSGSVKNSGDYKIKSVTDDPSEAKTFTTLTFSPADDLQDSAGGLKWLRQDEMIKVSGAVQAANNGYFWAKNYIDPTYWELSAANLANESGGSVTIRQGNRLTVTPKVDTEKAGPNVTLYTKQNLIAQAFTLPAAWSARRIKVMARKIGAPTDNLKISLAADNAGNPGTILGTQNKAAADIGSKMAWVSVDLASNVSLAANTQYWIVVERTGGASENCYAVGVNSDKEYSGGAMKVWSGSAWITRDPDGDLPFKLYALEETTSQLKRILETSQFIAGCTIQNASGVLDQPWRSGDLTIKAETEGLLAQGSSDSSRLLLDINPSRQATIYKEIPYSLSATISPILGDDGQLYDKTGGPWTLGLLPVGLWVRVNALSEGVNLAAPLSPFFCESASYDVESGTYSLTPKNTRSVWESI
jgi:hypothetical protein